MAPNLYDVYRTLERVPFGRQLTSRFVQVAAPYFLTIPASITSLEPGHGSARMWHAPWIRNHLGGVHAISLCNLAEFIMGAVAEASVPSSHRWIPRGMTVEYKAMARGTMYATAQLALPQPPADRQQVPVEVSVADKDDQEVFTATIDIWVTRKPARSSS
jgi:acyl-coenzyme A thioesterase PaaI-like protein